jgi:hypothetical protein
LQWSEDSGSESDPDIIAPGWNLPQQRSRAKAKKEESESEIDLARTNKATTAYVGRQQEELKERCWRLAPRKSTRNSYHAALLIIVQDINMRRHILDCMKLTNGASRVLAT